MNSLFSFFHSWTFVSGFFPHEHSLQLFSLMNIRLSFFPLMILWRCFHSWTFIQFFSLMNILCSFFHSWTFSSSFFTHEQSSSSFFTHEQSSTSFTNEQLKGEDLISIMAKKWGGRPMALLPLLALLALLALLVPPTLSRRTDEPTVPLPNQPLFTLP